MIRGFKVIHLLLVITIFTQVSFAQDKRGLGIFPMENFGNDQKYDWISFGISYLLSNKLSNLSAYYVPEQRVIEKAMREAGYPGKKLSGEMVYHVGKSSGINIGIVGNYHTNGKTIEVNVDFFNAFNGASIFSKNYKKNYNELFEITDDIARHMINQTAVVVSSAEQNIIDRQITKSVKAFQNFCLGYLENEKPSGQREMVVGLFRNAIREDPNFWEASFNLGIAYFNDHDYDQALKQFDRIIAALPDFEKPYYGRAMIHYRNNDFTKAKNDFQQVIRFNPNDYKPYYYLGRISIQLKQYDDAAKHLQKAAELNPDYSKIHIEMGNIYFDQSKYRGGIQHYRRALELDPEDIEALQKLGESYYRTQVYYSAYAQFKKILELEPNNPEANFMLGITAYKQAVLSELIEAFLELFESGAPENGKKKLTGTGRERSEVYREMVSAFGAAQRARENFLEATFNLALTYHDMGQLDSAETYYLKSLRITPDLVKVHIKLAKVYDDQGKRDIGLAQYKKVISIDPSYFIAHPTLGPEHDYINIVQVTLGELDEKLKNDPNHLESNQTMARIYFAQGYFGKAANIYRKILSLRPNDNEAKTMLAKLDRK